jgi:hypothetical protein
MVARKERERERETEREKEKEKVVRGVKLGLYNTTAVRHIK